MQGTLFGGEDEKTGDCDHKDPASMDKEK